MEFEEEETTFRFYNAYAYTVGFIIRQSRLHRPKNEKLRDTDQDTTMSKALAFEWPGMCHHLCIWIIYQNTAKHLSCVFEKFKDFAKDFSCCIYDYEDEEDFLIPWNEILKKNSISRIMIG